MALFRLVILSFLSFFAACSHGFDRGKLRESLIKDPLQINDQEILANQLIKPQLKLPFKLAIALSNQKEDGSWRWNAEDKERIEKIGTELIKRGIIKDAFILSSLFSEGEKIIDLRRAAAKYGADGLLIVRGRADIDSYLNPSAVLYLTIVGAFFVPGSHKDALFMIEGGLVDVNNGYLYATAEAEGENSTIRPSYFSEKEDAINPAKELALDKFTQEITTRIRNLQ